MQFRSPSHVKLFLFALLPVVAGCGNDPITVRVEAAERARGTALARKDVAAYADLMADDFLVVNHRGAILTRDARVGVISSGEERAMRRGEGALDVRRYGDVALVMGQSVWQNEGQEIQDYFTRIWVLGGDQWRMVGAHYTDITAQMTAVPRKFKLPDHPVPELPIALAPPAQDAAQEILRAIDDQHLAYWSKEPDRYRQYAGLDLLRVAENGVRTREELIAGMQGNSRLPAPPPEHVDLRVRVYGNVAVATYLDVGDDPWGRPAPARFTFVFVRRDIGWQMVHIQSTGVKG